MDPNNLTDYCSATNPSFRPVPQNYDGFTGCAIPINSTLVSTLIGCCSGLVDDKVINYNLTYEPFFSLFPQSEHEGPDCYAVCSFDVNTVLYSDLNNITRCLYSTAEWQNSTDQRFCAGRGKKSAASVHGPLSWSRTFVGLLGAGAWVLVSMV